MMVLQFIALCVFREYHCVPLLSSADALGAARCSKGEGFVTHNMRYVPAVSKIKKRVEDGLN